MDFSTRSSGEYGSPSPRRQRPDVRVGLCGFTMAMTKYASQFPVVEIQSIFYDPPADAALLRWRDATGPEVEYTMKVWQLVTHPASSPTYRRAKRNGEPPLDAGFFQDSEAVAHGWARSVACANVLGATAMLFQCPASFSPDPVNVQRLRRFMERIERPKTSRLVWEPRGPAWVVEHSLAEAICKDLDLVYALDPFVTPISNCGPIYWRLHGVGGWHSSYTDADLDELHCTLAASGASGPAYVFFNNIPRVNDARRFRALLETTPG